MTGPDPRPPRRARTADRGGAGRGAVRGAGAFAAMVAVAFAAAELLVGGCAEETTGVRVPNQAPQIRITSGPIEDSLHVYRVTFHWTADDADGRVESFEYAVDGDTLADSLRSTAEQTVALLYTADDFFDTVVEIRDGLPVELQRFGRHHTFHVRAIDDQGLRSPYATAAFFAVSVAPTTQIVNPRPATSAVTVGTAFEVTWTAEDIDGSEPPRRFATRLVPVPPDSVNSVPIGRLDCESCAPDWSAFGTETSVRFDVQEGAYLFGVRAMDESGAVEPELRSRENVLRLRVSARPGLPVVLFTGPDKVILLPTASPEEKTFDLRSGQSTSLAWEPDASHYGASVVSVWYAIDPETIDPGDPAWVLAARPGATVRFDNPAGVEEVIHGFYLLLRDSVGQLSVVDVILRVGPPDFRYDLLYVDDIGQDLTGSEARPSDVDRDTFILEVLLAEAGRRGLRVDEYEVQEPNGEIDEEAPDLAILRRYKLVLWSVGSTFSVLAEAMDPEKGFPIHEYLRLGGQVWLMGERVMGRTIPGPSEEFFGFTPDNFMYQFLHIESEFDGGQVVAGEFLRPRGNASSQRVDGMDGANPTPEAVDEGWPALLVTKPPHTSQFFGIPRIEGMVTGYEQGDRAGDLDTLYTYVTNGSRWPGGPLQSRLDDAPCAFRYEGPDHGKVMVFDFPIHWWSDGAADSLGTRAIEWFLDDEQP